MTNLCRATSSTHWAPVVAGWCRLHALAQRHGVPESAVTVAMLRADVGQHNPRYGSLFSGVGGFDMGFDRAGFECAWQVEIDPHASSVLRRHWPDVPKFGDVREVGAHCLSPVDVIIFGSPCQGLSVAGQRRGFEDERSGLFHEAIRVIRELRPAWAVWENVPGALSSAGGRDFGAALDALADSGAVAIGWRVLDAQHLGVPQRRRRVFTVAGFGDGADPSAVLFEPASLRRDSAPRRAAREGAAAGTGAGAESGIPELAGTLATSNQRLSAESQENFVLASTVRASDRNARPGGSDNLVVAPPVARALRASSGNANGLQASDNFVIADTVRSHPRPGSNSVGNVTIADTLTVGANQTTGFIGEDRLANEAPIAFDNHTGTSSVDASATLRAIEHGALPMVFAERGRADGRNVEPQTDLAYAVRNGSAGSGSHLQVLSQASSVRRLTPRECERLQGWPDDHTRYDDQGREIADSHRYRCIGNGVATPVAEWIARRLRAVLAPPP